MDIQSRERWKTIGCNTHRITAPQSRKLRRKGELGNLSIRFTKNGKEVTGINTLYQNYPNPFDQRTEIGINLTQSAQGILKVTDVTGRVIKSVDREWYKGYNEVWLDRREVKVNGILFYSFESGEFKATKRMILLQLI
ncbi:MAG: T9SS type A sorting domain-containing protein [Saprospiraceae bacterium]|nr:T9SS type A sorting domain-containing protein [Saprospiraceae bacterium]